MGDIIRITGIEAYARHGVTEEERAHPQPFLVDIAVEEDTSLAAINDDLVGTFWYADLVDDVVEELNSEPVRLRDTLAVRIAERLIERGAFHAEVTIHTPHFPASVPVEDATITVTRKHPLYDDELGIRKAVLRITSDDEDGRDVVYRAIDELRALNLYVDSVSEPIFSPVTIGDAKDIERVTLVAVVHTAMSPIQLAKEIQNVEVRLGRKPASRLVACRASVTIMTFGSLECFHPRLTLPHPTASTDMPFLRGWLSLEPHARIGAVPAGKFLPQE